MHIAGTGGQTTSTGTGAMDWLSPVPALAMPPMTQTFRNRPRILFVHGAAADARVWQPVIAALPPHCDAHAMTLTYFGDAAWPDDGAAFGTRVHARDVCEMARAMGAPVHVVGWSYAVHVVLQALLDAPELFASALLYEAGLGQYVADDADRDAFARDANSLFGAVGAKLAKEGEEAAVRQLVGPGFARLPDERQALYLSNARTMPLLMGGGEAPTKIGPAKLATIRTPCRVAIGEATRPAFAIPSRHLAAALPCGELTVIPGADHFLPETGPVLFAALVADWIEARA